MNYIGSKFSLLYFLHETVRDVIGNDLQDKTFCDIFAGTGAVGKSFKSTVKQVIANDCEYYSYVLNKNYIGNNQNFTDKDNLIYILNFEPLIDNGFIYKNYCMGSGSQRQYFSNHNGMKIDTIRSKIEDWMKSGEISENIYYFLLCSLLESADKVANTASVYGAFLKHIKTSAKRDLVLLPADFETTANNHKVFCEDANKLIKQITGDILYLDPPYNARQYGANYHLLNTIAEYEKFVPSGKTGLRKYTRSKYCSARTVKKEFESLIKNAQFEYIFLSYNNEGLMTLNEIRQIMSKYGAYDLAQTDYQRFKADKDENRKHKANSTIEYLHILQKE